jgi:hypothetical protein
MTVLEMKLIYILVEFKGLFYSYKCPYRLYNQAGLEIIFFSI